MLVFRNRRKAPRTGAFFLALIISCIAWPLAHAGEQLCTTGRYDETVTITAVHDGDTVRLSDGRRLRIIGINTPELARDTTPAEPFAVQARDALKRLIKPQPRVKLRWGKEKRDRHGRLLAHLFLSDGRNVSQQLLRQGMAMALVVPPNLWQWSCYSDAELKARSRGRGLWSHPWFQAKDSNKLHKGLRGFHLVQGRVQRVGFSKSSIWLNLPGRFAIRIKHQDTIHFKNVDFKTLKGKQIIARGWLNYQNNELRLRIRHPAALQIM